MDSEFLAPPQAYILLAVAATVGSITAAVVQSLFPRRPSDSPVMPVQSLSEDRKVVKRRRQVVLAFGSLLVISWTHVAVVMLLNVNCWTLHHWWHLVGLIALLAVFTAVILMLADRLSAVSTSFNESPPESGGNANAQ